MVVMQLIVYSGVVASLEYGFKDTFEDTSMIYLMELVILLPWLIALFIMPYKDD